MNIVSLVGSPRGAKGNTARLLKIVLSGAENEGAQTETIFLPGNTVLPCKACDTCHKKGKCAQKDEFESIKHKILRADGLVLAIAAAAGGLLFERLGATAAYSAMAAMGIVSLFGAWWLKRNWDGREITLPAAK